MTDLDDTKQNWELFGKVNPLGAILGGKADWDVDQFFATGEREVASLMARLKELDLDLVRNDCLDFGCGVGRLTQPLCKYFARCTGVDIAESMIEIANQFNQHPDRCRYVVNSQPNLHVFPDSSFDFVLSIIVLQHIEPESSRGYMTEFVRLLRPGGLAVFQIPSARRIGAKRDALPHEAYRAEIAVEHWPTSIPAGGRVQLGLRIRNLSGVAWPLELGIKAGNHWRSSERFFRDDGRVAIGDPLPPGGLIERALWVTAPTIPGQYRLEVDLVHEGITWFEQQGSTLVSKEIEVVATPTTRQLQGSDTQPAVPVMKMFSIAREEVEALITASGADVIDVAPYEVAGAEFESKIYIVGKAVATNRRPIVISESRPVPAEPSLSYHGLDRPNLGRLTRHDAIDMAGWIAWKGEPPVHIVVVHEDKQIASTTLNVARPDVRSVHPQISHAAPPGFRLIVPVQRLPRRFELTVCAVYEDGHSVPFRVVRGRHSLV